jgi:hypothetical protein
MIGVPGWKNMKYATAIMHAMEKVVATSISMPWRAFCSVLLMNRQRKNIAEVPATSLAQRGLRKASGSSVN